MKRILTSLALAFTLASPAYADASSQEASFKEELRHLRRLVACDTRVEGVTPPEKVTLKQVDDSCKGVKHQLGRYKKRWLDKARPFLKELVPADLPKTVVYPFGGADLLTALATYPDLELLTTMSLEGVGDPRAILNIDGADFKKTLAKQHAYITKLFQVQHNRTLDLQELGQSPIPAPLIFGLVALDLLGYEPLEARWFTLDKDGKVHYLTKGEIDAFGKTADGKKLKNRNEYFSNMELRFRKNGDANAKIQTWRHMRVNLGDEKLANSPTLKYLQSLGKVSAMTKAASYLIWRDDFSVIRNYLLDNMVWMISDTSGIGPSHAKAKGFEQLTWGVFKGNMFPGNKKIENEMIEMWETNPQRPTPIQYGYPDKLENEHLMVTRPKK